jgi:integrase
MTFRIKTRSARQALKKRKSKSNEPYWQSIEKGLSVGYRRGVNGGTWIVRHFSVETGREIEALGIADDFAEADGDSVLSFDQAQSAARVWWKTKLQEHSGEITPGHYTVGMAMDAYLTDSENFKRKKLSRTKLIIEGHIKSSRLGNIELSKLTHRAVKEWRDALATTPPRVRTRPGKPQAYRDVDMSNPDIMRARQATANRILTVLKAALNHAKSESRRIATDAAWVDVKPFSEVDVPKVRFLTMKEVAAFIPVCEPDFQKLAKGALVSGCRYGELTAMKVEAFSAVQGTVYVAESKNGESRYVELNKEGVAFFKKLTQGRDTNETMFLRSNGKAWKQSEQQRPMNAACDAAKLEGVTFHILRHTQASHAVMNGMPIKVLADNLGQKDTRITERHYAHLSQSYKKKLIRENAPTFGFDSKRGPQLVQKTA